MRSKPVPWRLMGAVALLASLALVASLTDAGALFEPESLRESVRQAGTLGFVLFVAAFAAGLLLHVPGILFVGAGLALYGDWLGGGAALTGALVAVSVSFWVVRLVGGSATRKITHPRLRKILDRLESQPVLTVAMLRVLTFLSPPVNYALALSEIRYRDYLLGSAAGLVAPMLVIVLASNCLAQV